MTRVLRERPPERVRRAPAAYARFAPLFGEMSEAMTRVLFGVLGALAPVLPPVQHDARQTEGEFAGYDGLENRGRLSNLLETEWLLRELDADDFLRRVAEDEVLFRRRDFHGDGRRRTLAVILDCGPWMLGRNRLVALAALFHLAVRADRTGARLVWTVPESGHAAWIDGLDREGVRQFLGQVVQAPVTEGSVTAALGRLDADGTLDCWYVGAARAAAPAQHPRLTSALLVRSLPGDAAAVEIDLIRRRRAAAKISVRLPDAPSCVAALRRPFRPVAAAPAPGTASVLLSSVPGPTDWIFGRANRAVLIRLREGLLWQPVVGPQAQPGTWLPSRPETHIIATQPDPMGRLWVLHTGPSEKPGQTCIRLQAVMVGPRELTPVPVARRDAKLDGLSFEGSGLGNLQVGATVVATDSAGRVATMAYGSGVGHLGPLEIQQRRVVQGDFNYVCELPDPRQGEVHAYSVSRESSLLRVPLDADPAPFYQAPRHVLFNPNTKFLCVSFDGMRYTVFAADRTFEVVMPEDLVLLDLQTPQRALVWSRASEELLLYLWDRGQLRPATSRAFKGPIGVAPRFCPLSQTVFALTRNDRGGPGRFVPIRADRDWMGAAEFDVEEAVAAARTEWLSA